MNQRLSAGVVIAGNPAKVIRDVTCEDKERWEGRKQRCIDLFKKYLKIGLQPVGKTDTRF